MNLEERWELMLAWRNLEQRSLDGGFAETLRKVYQDCMTLPPGQRVYPGCGQDLMRAKYAGWVGLDLREYPRVLPWDLRLGLPFREEHVTEVRVKLTLEFLSPSQAQFFLNEVARVLELGGRFTLTFRDLELLLARNNDPGGSVQDRVTLQRYLYGSQLYAGGARRSCWVLEQVIDELRRRGLRQRAAPQRSGQLNHTVVVEKAEERAMKCPRPGRTLKGNRAGDFWGHA